MNKYHIGKEEDEVYISLNPPSDSKGVDYLNSFINIWIDQKPVDSPFKTVEDAELFAKIIVKLLEQSPLGDKK